MTDYKKYINALRKCAKEHENDRTSTGHIIVSDLCRDTANLLEEVEQEPKTGHWIYDDEYSNWFEVTYKCSCCKRAIIVPYEARNEVYKDYPYCHCGAKMDEEMIKEGQ